jgi:hypothetical protein
MNLDQLLTDAARHVADQVDPPEVDLDAVRGRAHASRRRTAAVTLTVAALTAALVGIPLLTGPKSSTLRPAAPPTGAVIRTLPESNCDVPCLAPGVYSVGLGQDLDGQPRSAELTIPGFGWTSDGFVHRVSRRSEAGAVVLNVYQPDEFAGAEPCEAMVMTDVAPDATMDDVARLLTTLPQFAVVDGPRAVSAFGRNTRYLRLRADRISCHAVEGAQYNLANIYGGSGDDVGDADSDIDPDQPVLIEFWIVDLDGTAIVVEARQEGRPETAMIRRLDQVREQLTFVIGQ